MRKNFSAKFSAKNMSLTVLGTTTDILIWSIALVGASIGKTGPRGVYQAFSEADEIVSRINHRTLVATWHQLRKKRLITYKIRKNLYSPTVSKYGLKRLKEKIPQYHKKRPWDGKIYLITYDIPEEKSTHRDLFRRFIKKLGATSLQASVWLTPFNPRELLNNYVEKYNIDGSIIVSDIGKDGGIGETDIKDLLVKLYNLEGLNYRYEKFLSKAKSKSATLSFLLFEYLSILKDDPQLPFELLPGGWRGNDAYKVYQNLIPENTVLKDPV